MISVSTAWISFVAIILAFWVMLLVRSGPRVALGVAVVLSFLSPEWVELEWAGLPFDVQLTVAIVALIGFVLHPDRDPWTPLTLPDCVIASLVVVQVASDIVADGISIGSPLRAYGEWAVPYLSGRYAVRNQEELRKIAPWVIGVLLVFTAGALCEMLTGINLWELLFARNADDYVPKLGRRLGFTRATGPTINPIFFAMIFLLLLPWPAVTFNQVDVWGRRWRGGLAGLSGVVGMLATISRGPLTGLMVAAGLLCMIRIPRTRWLGAGVAAVCFACVLIWPTEIIEFSRTGIKDQTKNATSVELDGEEIEYSGSLTRLLLFRAYAKPLRYARFLGYGTEACQGFPPNIPHLPEKSEAIYLMRHVDNAYVLMGLRSGWLGMMTFTLLWVVTVWTAIILARIPELTSVCSWLAGVIAASAFVLLTVYFASDFAPIFLWTSGLVSGLATHALKARREVRRRH